MAHLSTGIDLDNPGSKEKPQTADKVTNRRSNEYVYIKRNELQFNIGTFQCNRVSAMDVNII